MEKALKINLKKYVKKGEETNSIWLPILETISLKRISTLRALNSVLK